MISSSRSPDKFQHRVVKRTQIPETLMREGLEWESHFLKCVSETLLHATRRNGPLAKILGNSGLKQGKLLI